LKTVFAFEVKVDRYRTIHFDFGIPVTEDGKVQVGESGRGRKLVEVPIPPGTNVEKVQYMSDWDAYMKSEYRALLLEAKKYVSNEVNTVYGRRALKIPVSVEGAVAVLLLRDMSGFRGGWRITHARPWEEWEEAVRRWYAHYSGGQPENGRNPGHEGHVTDCPKCREEFHIPPRREMDDVHTHLHVIAEGRRAQGDAGYMGGGPEYLLVLREGDAFECVRSGRLYGGPSVVRFEVIDGVVRACVPFDAAEQKMSAARW